MPKKIKKQFICKFQRPIWSNQHRTPGTELILIYNEDRSISAQMEIYENEIDSLFPCNEFKTYWMCRINNKTKMLEPIEQVKEQEW